MSEINLRKESLSAFVSRLGVGAQSASDKIKNNEAFSFYFEKIQKLTHAAEGRVGGSSHDKANENFKINSSREEFSLSQDARFIKNTESAQISNTVSSPEIRHVVAETASQSIHQLVSNIVQYQQLQAPPQSIPHDEQNVVNSSLKSSFVYTSNKFASNNTLWQLEDGLRRATDIYHNALQNAKSGYCSFIDSNNGQIPYLTRDEQIAFAKSNVEKATSMFARHSDFMNDPVARAISEVSYQIAYGKASSEGITLSERDQILVRERRAGNDSTDGSIDLIKS